MPTRDIVPALDTAPPRISPVSAQGWVEGEENDQVPELGLHGENLPSPLRGAFPTPSQPIHRSASLGALRLNRSFPSLLAKRNARRQDSHPEHFSPELHARPEYLGDPETRRKLKASLKSVKYFDTVILHADTQPLSLDRDYPRARVTATQRSSNDVQRFLQKEDDRISWLDNQWHDKDLEKEEQEIDVTAENEYDDFEGFDDDYPELNLTETVELDKLQLDTTVARDLSGPESTSTSSPFSTPRPKTSPNGSQVASTRHDESFSTPLTSPIGSETMSSYRPDTLQDTCGRPSNVFSITSQRRPSAPAATKSMTALPRSRRPSGSASSFNPPSKLSWGREGTVHVTLTPRSCLTGETYQRLPGPSPASTLITPTSRKWRLWKKLSGKK